jgi:hypothetical protein
MKKNCKILWWKPFRHLSDFRGTLGHSWCMCDVTISYFLTILPQPGYNKVILKGYRNIDESGVPPKPPRLG